MDEDLHEWGERYVWAMCQVAAMTRALALAPRIPDSMVEVRGPNRERYYLCLRPGWEMPEGARKVDCSLVVPV